MRRGFTLIELTISITLMAILIGVYFLAANPGGQLASSRNTERKLHLQTIMNNLQQAVADQGKGGLNFSCSPSGLLPTSTMRMTSVSGPGNYNIAPCLIPTYAFSLPFDPIAAGGHYASASDYDTGYGIVIASSGVITLSAPYAELGKTITYP